MNGKKRIRVRLMGEIKLLGLAGLLLSSEAFSQEAALEQKTAQTSLAFDEVLEFINGKLALYGFGEYSGIDLGENGGETRSYTQKVEKETNCTLRFIYHETAVPWRNRREKEERVTVTQVPLELAAVSVRSHVESFPSYDKPMNYKIKIDATRLGRARDIFPVNVDITHFYPVTRYDPSIRESPSHREYSNSSLSISFSNLEAAEDVRGMLSYALELCQTKAKKF